MVIQIECEECGCLCEQADDGAMTPVENTEVERLRTLLVACRPSVRADLTSWEQLVLRKRNAGSLNQCDEDYAQRIFDLLEQIDALALETPND